MDNFNNEQNENLENNNTVSLSKNENETVMEEQVGNVAQDNGYTAPQNEIPSYTYDASQSMGYSAAPSYTYESAPVSNEGEGLCIAAFVLGIVAFFINPVYVCSILAIIFGFIGQSKNNTKKSFATWGWILGFSSIALQFIADLTITILTLGTGAFSFCC